MDVVNFLLSSSYTVTFIRRIGSNDLETSLATFLLLVPTIVMLHRLNDSHEEMGSDDTNWLLYCCLESYSIRCAQNSQV